MQGNALKSAKQWKHRLKLRSVPVTGKVPALYDRYLENDGHHWLSYVSYSGVRRYVDLGKIKGTTDKPSPKPTKEVTPTSSVKLYGRMAITDISSDGFTITISEVDYSVNQSSCLV